MKAPTYTCIYVADNLENHCIRKSLFVAVIFIKRVAKRRFESMTFACVQL